MNEPLIWTTRGNVPVSSLTYETRWEHAPEHYIKFVEIYRAADGEVVKESAHVYAFQGLTADAVAAQL